MNKRRIALLLGFVLLVGGSAAGWFLLRREAAPTYQTVKADRGAISAKVTATGTLSALVTVQVGSQVSGRIQEIDVDFNSRVKKGQVLAKLDPELVEASVNQARANHVETKSAYQRAQVQATLAKRRFERTRQLAEQQLIAMADLDTAQADMDVAATQVDGARGSMQRAQAALNQAEVNLAYTTITSPINGVVISRDVAVGQTVAASLQAPTLFVIAQDLKQIQVDASIAEADMGKVRAGMKAEFSVDAYPEETFRGKVRQVRNSALTVQNVVTYSAIIDVENPELKLKPGMTANVSLIHDERRNAVRLPNAALRFRPASGTYERPNRRSGSPHAQGERTGQAVEKTGAAGRRAAVPSGRDDNADRRTIWILVEGKPLPVRIETGLSDGNVTEVIGGNLSDGADVIVDSSTGAAASNARSGSNRRSGQSRNPRMF